MRLPSNDPKTVRSHNYCHIGIDIPLTPLSFSAMVKVLLQGWNPLGPGIHSSKIFLWTDQNYKHFILILVQRLNKRVLILCLLILSAFITRSFELVSVVNRIIDNGGSIYSTEVVIITKHTIYFSLSNDNHYSEWNKRL